MINIVPSLLATDFSRLGEEIRDVTQVVTAASANILVAGKAVFRAEEGMATAIRNLKASRSPR